MKSANLQDRTKYIPDTHRILPQSLDAERGILSSFVLSPVHVGELLHEKHITPEHFHLPAHGVIFEVLMGLWRDQKPIDFIILTDQLRETGKLDNCGGPAFITELFTFLPTAANASYYTEIATDKHTLRELIRVCTEFAARAYEETEMAPALVSEAEEAILGISRFSKASEDDYKTTHDTVMEVMHDLDAAQQRKGAIGGISTGFHKLDEMTDGLHPGEMIVIAARPSMGKTALAMNMGESMAIHHRIPTAVFSLEMTRKQLVQRMIMGRARVNWVKFRSGYMEDRDSEAIGAASGHIAAAPLYINDKHGISIAYASAILRRLKRKHNIQVAIFDYLQLLHGAKKYKGGERHQEVAEISGGLKNLAKELNIPIVVLAQLSRAPEGRGGESKGRPKLSDIRESGSVEQDADVVGLLHRDQYYAETPKEIEETEGKATLIIAKSRNGPTGDIPLTFLKDFTRFENCAREGK